jgi:two-component system, LytTR family, sensor histidine kinase AlgZ
MPAPNNAKPKDPPDPLDPHFAPESRAASLWPDSTRPAPLASTQFGAEPGLSRFDPLADEREHGRQQSAAAFDVCHPALALRVLLFVQAVLVITVLAGFAPEVWVHAQAVASFAGLAGTLLWLVLLCLGRPVWRRLGSVARSAAVLSLGGVCAGAGVAPMVWAGLVDLRATNAVGVALAGAVLAALAWAWLELRARLWQPALASARLAELQSRIRPHFLFNALNTALALVRVDPDRAERVLEDLSTLFREALAETGSSVTLDEEIDLAQRYLAIEQVRFGDRLRVSWDIDPRAGRARVPPLVLQPLVENAVRHGVEPALDGGHVQIQAAVRSGQAVLLVSNSVSDEPSRPGSGMALANVRERLRLLHDVGAQCDTWRDGAIFHARIVVPL